MKYLKKVTVVIVTLLASCFAQQAVAQNDDHKIPVVITPPPQQTAAGITPPPYHYSKVGPPPASAQSGLVGPRPSAEHALVSDEWITDGSKYKKVNSHWEKPPHAGMKWQSGHWHKVNGRSVWVKGKWQ